MHTDLVLRRIGSMNLIVCPRRKYGHNVFAVTNSAAEIFTLWKQGKNEREIVSELSLKFTLPEGFTNVLSGICCYFEKLNSNIEIDYGSFNYNEMPPLDVSDFGAERSFWEDRIPVYGGIEPTWNCNLNCCHCYIKNSDKKILSFDEWKVILDQLADSGCLHLAITGGEPLFYCDFEKLYKYAVCLGFIVTVFTNGTLITNEIAELFNNYPPRRVEISIYGMTERSYESVTGVIGSYNRFMSGLRKLNKYRDRVPVILKSVLLKENLEERESIKAFAIKMGYPLAQNSLIRLRVDGRVGPEEHRITSDEVAMTEMEIQPEREAWDEFSVGASPISSDSDVVECSAGNVAFQIDPLGKIGYCVISREPGINLLKIPMSKAWNMMGEVRSKYFVKPIACRTCADSKYCDFCPGYDSLGDISSSPDGDRTYYCSVAKKRRERMEEHSKKGGIKYANT